MTGPRPFVREEGEGPAVVCLHANASTSSQWRGLMRLLAPTHRVLAVDGWGAGQSPAWPSDRVISLQDEADLLAPVLDALSTPVVLVGHSYGAAVAFKVALTRPGAVRALAVYEPTLFGLIEADGAPPNEADGIRAAIAAAAAALDAGDRDAAAAAFIDYWMAPGAWAATPAHRRPAIAQSVTQVRRWAHALMTEPTPLAAFRALDLPVLLMTGGRSTTAAHGVARRLAGALPRVTVRTFAELGHMGPVTHPEPVNEAIRAFLTSV
ncbi:alpha/beta fold hydrolase [Aquabacterium sp. J223]|uniref:alpha/beta fold hydrolase n=1 Tax=Aquabacterium sp. J223 TaxID=2898431 RepID=UPI0021AE248B|nr:alpha/beta hydrolase [Aquabacterium sp. J223]UUX97180.1 alpha/beta hydrolase [Aquabacterium sp. J223]